MCAHTAGHGRHRPGHPVYTHFLRRDKISSFMASNINDNAINRLYTFKPLKYNTLEHNVHEDYIRLIHAIIIHHRYLGALWFACRFSLYCHDCIWRQRVWRFQMDRNNRPLLFRYQNIDNQTSFAKRGGREGGCQPVVFRGPPRFHQPIPNKIFEPMSGTVYHSRV